MPYKRTGTAPYATQFGRDCSHRHYTSVTLLMEPQRVPGPVSSQHPVIPSHLAVIALCDAPASYRTVHWRACVPDHLHSKTIHSLFTTQFPTTRADFERTPVDSGVLRRLSSGSCPIYLGVPRTQTHSLYTACMPHSRCSPLHQPLTALLSGTTEYGWACS